MELPATTEKKDLELGAKLLAKLKPSPPEQQPEYLVKPTAKRYLILLLFVLNFLSFGFQYIQLSANTKKISHFYGVEHYVINSSAVLFSVAYLALSIPTCYLIDRIGLRNSVLLSSLCTALGSTIKCFSCDESGLYLLFVGLFLVSLAEQLIYSITSRLASVWFPDRQVCLVVALSTGGYQFGEALGLLVPQIQLGSAKTNEEISASLFNIHLGVAVASILTLVAGTCMFDEAPKHAPGQARLKQMREEALVCGQQTSSRPADIREQMVLRQAGQLLRDRNYLLLNMSYAINISLTYSLPVVMNQILDSIWPGEDLKIAGAAFVGMISKSFASLLLGKLMDRYRRYKLINILFTFGALFGFIFFGLAIEFVPKPAAVYLAASFLGIHQTGLIIGGLELAVELTYPAPEIVTSTMMNTSLQFFAIFTTFTLSYLADNFGNFATTSLFVCGTLMTIVLQLNITESLKRQSAAKS